MYRLALLLSCALLCPAFTLPQERFGILGKLVSNNINAISKATSDTLGIVNDAVKLGTTLTKDAVNAGTGIGKLAVTAGTTLAAKGVKEGTSLAAKGLGIATTATSGIPIVGSKVQLVAGMGSGALALANDVVLGALDKSEKIAHTSLTGTNAVVSLTTGTIANAANIGTSLTQKLINPLNLKDKVDQAATGVVEEVKNKAEEVKNTIASVVPQIKPEEPKKIEKKGIFGLW